MNGIIRFLPLGLVSVLCWSGSLFADYTLVLKNGRRITVQSYREEGGMIKFPGLGGEIGITKDQIQSILKDGDREGRGMVFPGTKGSPPRPAGTSQEEKKVARPAPGGEGKIEEKKGGPVDIKEKAQTPEERRAEKRAKEEKKYQKRVREITARIKQLRDRYAVAIRGSTDPGPKHISQAEAIRLVADKGGKLSELKKQIGRLTDERERLIQEMRRKNFDTGSLFLE